MTPPVRDRYAHFLSGPLLRQQVTALRVRVSHVELTRLSRDLLRRRRIKFTVAPACNGYAVYYFTAPPTWQVTLVPRMDASQHIWYSIDDEQGRERARIRISKRAGRPPLLSSCDIVKSARIGPLSFIWTRPRIG